MKTTDEILAAMEQVMGPLPPQAQRGPLDIVIEREEVVGNVLRCAISYRSAGDERVPAYLLIPQNLAAPAPAALCLHQTSREARDETVGIGGLPNLWIGKDLARRGYVVLAPDYPTLGTHDIDLAARGWGSGSRKAIWDNSRGIDVLESLPEVAAGRIGAIGHSLGGHNALFTAAFEPRIRAVATSCGFTAFAHYYGGDLTGWTSARYMPRIATHFPTPAAMPFDFSDVLVAIAPRPVYINAPLHDDNFAVAGVRETIERVASHFPADRLIVRYPGAGHDWPEAERFAAYDALDRWLAS